MTSKPDPSFVVVRFNSRTYLPGKVVAVIKGNKAAERILKDLNSCLSEESRRAGWRYFLEETDLKPGMDAERATSLRQLRFDSQEARRPALACHPSKFGQKLIS